MRETPDFAKQKFLYRLSRSDYEREWGKTYERPGLGTRILSTLLRFAPRIGPFKSLGFNNPTPQTEDLYIKSIIALAVLKLPQSQKQLVVPGIGQHAGLAGLDA